MENTFIIFDDQRQYVFAGMHDNKTVWDNSITGLTELYETEDDALAVVESLDELFNINNLSVVDISEDYQILERAQEFDNPIEWHDVAKLENKVKNKLVKRSISKHSSYLYHLEEALDNNI